jgi:hypothetical protein
MESELRAIAEEAARWTVETGGDLFGQWASVLTIYLATRTGPHAVRDRTHFRLDVNYLRTLSAALAADWDLRYLGPRRLAFSSSSCPPFLRLSPGLIRYRASGPATSTDGSRRVSLPLIQAMQARIGLLLAQPPGAALERGGEPQ